MCSSDLVITLNDLLDDALVARRSRLIVKLDVEGMEIAAIKGGSRLLERDAILIVEDHGSDRAHSVSRYILDETPCKVFVLDPQADRFVWLTDVSMLDRFKATSSIGYNIFATNSLFWENRLRCVPRRALHCT